MSAQEIIIGVVAGLLVNEFCDISPWVAGKVVRWSAGLRYGRSVRAEIRAEELAAVIDSRPGKLFKLITALGFAGGAAGAWLYRLYTVYISDVVHAMSVAFEELTLQLFLSPRKYRALRPNSPAEQSLWRQLRDAQRGTSD